MDYIENNIKKNSIDSENSITVCENSDETLSSIFISGF